MVACTKCKSESEDAGFYYSGGKRRQPCKPCQLAMNAAWRDKNRAYFTEHCRNFYRDLKDDVIAAYGSRCGHCGETERQFLTLDHVNGGGNKERAATDTNFPFKDAKSRNFPPDYQVLCWNCNWKKHAVSKEQGTSRGAKYLRRLKDAVIASYGGACKCCGGTDRGVLTLDHVEGGGAKQRRSQGVQFAWRDARRRGFPLDYQVLCFSCNCAKAYYGLCPHVHLVGIMKGI